MDNLNYIFFEEYKHLNRLCAELYNDQSGVTHYIDDMKSVFRNEYQFIPNWKKDLDQLVRLRHIRNDLAHREGAFSEKICTQSDIDWIRVFYKRIMTQSDPISMLYQHSNAKKQISQQVGMNYQGSNIIKQINRQDDKVVRHSSNNASMVSYWIAIILVVALVFTFLLGVSAILVGILWTL